MPQIIENECIGCGICTNICPEGIEMVGEKARIKNENAECLKDAANACPRSAIILDDKEKQDKEIKKSRIKGYNQGFVQGIGIRGGGKKGGVRKRRRNQKGKKRKMW